MQEIKRLDSGKPRKQVFILGAGIAGLVAAYELTRLGHSCEVIEASTRPGGRIFTHRFSSKQYGELGAMRIPASHDYTRHYISELRLTLRPFIDNTTQGFYDLRNLVARQGMALEELVKAFMLTPQEQGVIREKGIGFILGSIVAEEIEKLSGAEKEDLFAGNITTQNLRYLDNTAVRSALKQRWSHGAVSLAGSATTLESLWERPLAKYVRDAISENGLGLSEIVGGMDLLPMKLADELSAVVQYQTEVVAVQLRSNGRLKLVLRDDGRSCFEKTPHFVLCTIPFGVLRHLQLDGLSAAKMEAIRNTSYASATKVLLHCSARFWETQYKIVGGRSVSDGISRQTYYPSDNAPPPPGARLTSRELIDKSQPHMWGIHTAPEILPKIIGAEARDRSFLSKSAAEGPGVLLSSYSWGLDSQRLGGLSDSDRVEAAARSVSRFHPEVLDYIDSHASKCWEQNRWSMGAYADTFPGDAGDYYHDGLMAEGNLFFAGEHLSPFHGWIQGGIYSSLRAVAEIAAA